MSFLEQLRQTLACEAEVPAPQTLRELATRLRTLVGPSERLAQHCRDFARRCQETRQHNEQALGSTRGRLFELWSLQDATYQDLIEHLQGAARLAERGHASSLIRLADSLDELLLELRDSIDAMEQWRQGGQRRCLACGWSDDEQAEVCPSCELTLMRPARELRGGSEGPAELGPTQQQLYQSLTQVAAGCLDLAELGPPLDRLRWQLRECQRQLSQAEPGEERGRTEQLLNEAERGLDEIELAFDSLDAQHLEDGWHRYFQAELALRSEF